MISNDTHWDPYRIDLARDTRVQISSFLQNEAAEKLRHCLLNEVPFALAERSEGASKTIAASDYNAMDKAARDAQLHRAYTRARSEFQFVYESYMMVKAAKEGRDPGLLLHAILAFLNSEDFINFARWLCNEPRISHVSAQATCYRSGHFLTLHQDKDANEDRAYAYVINLSKNWRPDWGGLLQFHAANGDLSHSFVPHWNTLSLFKVPQDHSVSMVAPFSNEPRLAITGWFLRPSVA